MKRTEIFVHYIRFCVGVGAGHACDCLADFSRLLCQVD